MDRPLFGRVLRLPLPLRNAGKLRDGRRAERPARRPRAAARPAARVTATTKVLAWGVHLYTAMGLVCAAGMAALLFQGGPDAFRGCFALMGLATFIDATDGTLARRIRIKEVIPGFDGRRLDDITDFLTYTALPLVLVWRAGLVPEGTAWLLVVPLLASAYGFCQTDVKTADGYFLGFPSLWNVVAFYLYLLQLPGWATLGVLLVLAAFTFVPSKYLYPSSKPGALNLSANVLGAVWGVVLVYVGWALPGLDALRSGTADRTVMAVGYASLFYPLFYLGASWTVTLRDWSKAAKTRRHTAAAGAATPAAEPPAAV